MTNKSRSTHRKQKVAALSCAVFSLGMVAAADAGAAGCGTPNPLAFTLPFSYSCSPAWDAQMQGKTASVTVTGTGTVTLLSFKTQPQRLEGDLRVIGSFPQAGYDVDQVTLTGGTATLTVDVPSCFYQLDVVNGDPDPAVKSIGVTSPTAGVFSESAPVVAAILGGTDDCFPKPKPEPEPEPEPNPKPEPNPNPNPNPPVLPPVPTPPTTPGQGAQGGTSTPQGTKRACTAVTARSYRVRAKQRNTITVRVKTTAKTKPRVTLSGSGVKTSKKVGSNNTAVFRVRPTRAGSIRVTATGCVKVASVKVRGAKTSQRSGTAPTFTG